VAQRIVKFLRIILPTGIYRRVYLLGVFLYKTLVVPIYSLAGRPEKILESAKAKPRRIREEFFTRYCVGQGLDIGYGGDLLADNCRGWDLEDGDAQHLHGLPDDQFDFVYSSHTLEHMSDVTVALRNWWRVVKPGGFLLLYLPHRDLYEKSETLPSRWNPDHNCFFLPDEDEPPDTIGLRSLISKCLEKHRIIYIKSCDEGHTITDPNKHSDGEYSIETVVQKLNG